MSKTGTVYLIGAGPGDRGLITVKGKKLLQKADVIVYDYLVNTDLLDFAKENAEIIYVGKKAVTPFTLVKIIQSYELMLFIALSSAWKLLGGAISIVGNEII